MLVVIKKRVRLEYAISFILRGTLLPKHDVILIYSPPLPLGLTGWCIRLFRRIPFVVNVQDLFPQSAIDLYESLRRSSDFLDFYVNHDNFLLSIFNRYYLYLLTISSIVKLKI